MEKIKLMSRLVTGHVCVEYLKERYIDGTMVKYYGGLDKEKVEEIFEFVGDLRFNEKYGQRNIVKKIKEEFGVLFSESTISGWIHKGNIPFAQEKTQFKLKPKPSKKILEKLYLIDKQSASSIAKKFQVSTVIVINWLGSYSIKIRTHKESMNTKLVKQELRRKKLRLPTKQYDRLSNQKAYILGVLCGDAFINTKILRLEIRNDIEFIKEFVNCLKYVYGLDFNILYYAPKRTLKTDVSNETICDDLLSYGQYNTFNWQVPKEILNSKNNQIISSFIRGFYDSEGSVSKYTITSSSVNTLALQQIQFLLKKLNIIAKLYTYEKYSVLTITNKINRKRFFDFVGFTIKRKIEKLRMNLK